MHPCQEDQCGMDRPQCAHPSTLTKYNASETQYRRILREDDRQMVVSFDDILVTEFPIIVSSSYLLRLSTEMEAGLFALNYVTSDKEYKV
jgi:hypothetical protein